MANAQNEFPLHMAVLRENVEVAKIVLKYSVDVNMQNRSARTPLHMAVSSGAFRGVEFLLGCTGIDVNIRDNMLRTPLFDAVGTRGDSIFHLLWQRREANRDDRDVYGDTM